MFEKPILFIIFNRPDVTFRVFEQLRQLKPRHLFVAADGPRADVPGEADLCARARTILDRIDWDCELHTMLRQENAGCGRGVSEAISWMFGHHDQGIILEDDCLPHPDFFSFCASLLDQYAHHEHIMHIGGNNSQFGKTRNPYSYYFSKYPHIWGWATWKRAWERFRFDLSNEDLDTTLPGIFKDYHFTKPEQDYWAHMFRVMKTGAIDTWDIQWTYSCWANRGMTAVPNANLISNIGFDSNATHTRTSESKLANQPLKPIGNIIHPPSQVIDDAADEETFNQYNRGGTTPWHHHLRKWASKLIPQPLKNKLKNAWSP